LLASAFFALPYWFCFSDLEHALTRTPSRSPMLEVEIANFAHERGKAATRGLEQMQLQGISGGFVGWPSRGRRMRRPHLMLTTNYGFYV
jgi:hypothetical protein